MRGLVITERGGYWPPRLKAQWEIPPSGFFPPCQPRLRPMAGTGRAKAGHSDLRFCRERRFLGQAQCRQGTKQLTPTEIARQFGKRAGAGEANEILLLG